MPKIKVKGQTVQAGEDRQTDKRTDGRISDGRYQKYYLPCFAVDKKKVLYIRDEASIVSAT